MGSRSSRSAPGCSCPGARTDRRRGGPGGRANVRAVLRPNAECARAGERGGASARPRSDRHGASPDRRCCAMRTAVRPPCSRSFGLTADDRPRGGGEDRRSWGGVLAAGAAALAARDPRASSWRCGKRTASMRAEVESEHLLLALVGVGDGVGARILLDAGADDEAIRATLAAVPAWEVGEPSPAAATDEIEVDLGWRGRPIALAALGAAVLGPVGLHRRRTGGLTPIEMQVLVHLALAAGPRGATFSSRRGGRVARRRVGLRSGRRPTWRSGHLLRQGLVARPAGVDDDCADDHARAGWQPACRSGWDGRSSLFDRWPPAVPGRRRRVTPPALARSG